MAVSPQAVTSTTVRSSLIALLIDSPNPPAPMNVPSVAVPTLMIRAVLMPAGGLGTASGSSMRKNSHLGHPMPRAASIMERSTCRKPTMVFRRIVRNEYATRATMHG